MIAMLAEDALSDAGFSVRVAASGKAAILLAQVMTFDAAVVDLGLPDMSGAELVTALLGTNPDMVLVVSTGYTDTDGDGHLRAAPRLPVDVAADAMVLLKPWNVDDLRSAVRGGLEARGWQF
jgi:DNA-binding response OmpR family regulator